METSKIKKQFGVLWLNKSGFDLHILGSQQPFRHPFTTDIISYLEVLDESKLETDIKLFVEQNKIPSSFLVMVLSQDVLFENEFVETTPEQMKETELQFIDTVPFENIYSKIWKVGNKPRLVAVNADLFSTLKIAFEKVGISMEIAIPYFVTGVNAISVELTNMLFKKYEVLKNESIVESHLNFENEQVKPESLVPVKRSKREFVLIGIFILLMLVLFLVVYWQFFRKTA